MRASPLHSYLPVSKDTRAMACTSLYRESRMLTVQPPGGADFLPLQRAPSRSIRCTGIMGFANDLLTAYIYHCKPTLAR